MCIFVATGRLGVYFLQLQRIRIIMNDSGASDTDNSHTSECHQVYTMSLQELSLLTMPFDSWLSRRFQNRCVAGVLWQHLGSCNFCSDEFAFDRNQHIFSLVM